MSLKLENFLTPQCTLDPGAELGVLPALGLLPLCSSAQLEEGVVLASVWGWGGSHFEGLQHPRLF